MRLVSSTKRTLWALFQIFLILFGLYIFVQILIKVFGGSWSAENLIIALLMCNLGILFSLVFFLARMHEDFKHHKRQFRSMTSDFKQLRRDVYKMSVKVDNVLMKIG